MKRIVWASAVALALAVAPAAAQTRVSVDVGFGVPRPYGAGAVVVYRPDWYDREPRVVVLPPRRPFYARGAFVFVRHGYGARYYRRHHCEYDDDDDE